MLGDDVPGDEINVAWKAGFALRLSHSAIKVTCQTAVSAHSARAR
jgi:hypothetical protein